MGGISLTLLPSDFPLNLVSTRHMHKIGMSRKSPGYFSPGCHPASPVWQWSMLFHGTCQAAPLFSLAALGLHCSTGTFSSCRLQLEGFSCYGTQALDWVGLVVPPYVGFWLPARDDQGSNKCTLHWNSDSLPLEHQEVPGNPLLKWQYSLGSELPYLSPC